MSERNPRGKDLSPRRAVIVGGGISGLAAAHRLQELGRARGLSIDARVLESASRLGGQVRTWRDGGFLFEGGPDSMVTQKPSGLELCRRLGLESQIIYPVLAQAGMQVVHCGRLVRLPEGFLMVAPSRMLPLLRSPLFSWRGKIRMAMERFVPRRGPRVHDESPRQFVTRRFGSELYERAVEPIVGGLFTADADKLSLRMTMPRFLELERRHGSLTTGMARVMQKRSGSGRRAPAVFSLKGGVENLVATLTSRLPQGSSITGAPVERIRFDAMRSMWKVRASERTELDAEVLILACPSYVSAPLLESVDSELSGLLARLEYASCVTVNLAYRPRQMRRRLDGYGFFVPRGEGLPLLAANYVSAKFAGRAPNGALLLRAFLGGATAPGILDRTDHELVDEAHRTLSGLLEIAGQPLLSAVHRAPRSMPQFPVGDAERLARLDERLAGHPGLLLCGGAVGAVGLPDCIASGERAARAALGFLRNEPRELELAI